MTAWVDTAQLDQFEHIWVGAKSKILWQFHRTDGSDLDVPGTISDDLSVVRLFAVAVDRDGITWVKRLNRELLSVPESADPQMFKSGQALPITCSDDLMALLLDDFKSTLAPGGKLIDLPGPIGASERRQVLQSLDLNTPSIDTLNDHQWHQLTDQLKQDGSLADQLPSIRMQLAPNGGDIFLPQSDDPRFVHLVPEPTSAATMLLISAALLARRRNRK
jgi:hypothetical protein